MDYGYMCAFDDVVASAADRVALRSLGDRITRARIDAWTMEHHPMGVRLTPPPNDPWQEFHPTVGDVGAEPIPAP